MWNSLLDFKSGGPGGDTPAGRENDVEKYSTLFEIIFRKIL